MPYCLFVEMLAGDTLIGGGQSVRQSQGVPPAPTRRSIISSSSCRSTRPRRRSTRRPRPKASRTGCSMLHFKKDWSFNPELPTIGPWKHGAADQHADLGARAQSLLLGGRHRGQPAALHRPRRHDAGRGSRGHQPARHRRQLRHAGAPHRPRQAAGHPGEPQKGNYTVHLDLGAARLATRRCRSTRASRPIRRSRSGCTNADFRRALSLGIDRNQLNETFWLGVGTPGSAAPAESAAAKPGPEWRTKWSTLRSGQGQPDARRDRAHQEGQRRLPRAHRQRRAAAHPGPGRAGASCPGRSRRR